MDNHPRDLTKVMLSMNINCCEKCPKILEKKILRMEGVDTVAIYVEENLVSVIGTMDPTTLLNDVAKLGKTVKLLFNDKYTKNTKNHFQENGNTQTEGHGHTREKGKKQKHCCSSHEVWHEHRKEEEEHKCEAYVPPKVDERACRSYYCPDHPKLRKILNRVPEENSAFFGGGLYSSGCSGYCGGYPCRDPYMYPRGYPEMPQFGYGRQPRMRPFGFM